MIFVSPFKSSSQFSSLFSEETNTLLLFSSFDCSLLLKMSKTMKAVVFKGKLNVQIEDRPVPKIIDPTDIIIKVKYSALCGR